MNPPSYRPKSLKCACSLGLETLLVGTLETRLKSGFFLCFEVSILVSSAFAVIATMNLLLNIPMRHEKQFRIKLNIPAFFYI